MLLLISGIVLVFAILYRLSDFVPDNGQRTTENGAMHQGHHGKFSSPLTFYKDYLEGRAESLKNALAWLLPFLR